MIVTPLLRFFSDKAESSRHRTPHPTPETSKKQGLADVWVDKSSTLQLTRRVIYIAEIWSEIGLLYIVWPFLKPGERTKKNADRKIDQIKNLKISGTFPSR